MDSGTDGALTELLDLGSVEAGLDGALLSLLDQDGIRRQVKTTSEFLGALAGLLVHAGFHATIELLALGHESLYFRSNTGTRQHSVDLGKGGDLQGLRVSLLDLTAWRSGTRVLVVILNTREGLSDLRFFLHDALTELLVVGSDGGSMLLKQIM